MRHELTTHRVREDVDRRAAGDEAGDQRPEPLKVADSHHAEEDDRARAHGALILPRTSAGR